MTKEETYKKLDELYSNNKSKNFVNHLVRSYFPVENVSRVLDKPKGSFVCVLSNVKLISINEALSGAEDKDSVKKHLDAVVNPESKAEIIPIKLPDTRLLGVTGSETDTFMCTELFAQFYSWVLGKFLKGDKHISWLLKDVNKRQFTGGGKSNGRKNTVKGATYTLGDLGVLQALKKTLK